jgi:hypothetical protein
MNNFWSFTIFGVLFTLLIACLQSSSTDSYEFKTKPIQSLDDELRNEFLKPNNWGYSVVLFPHLSRFGFTRSLDIIINLNGTRLKSISGIEKLHATIYGEIFSRLNHIRKIRPFLANFPLSPDSLELSIGFYNENGKQLPPPCFASIVMSCGTLEFNHFIQDKAPVPFETIIKKTVDNSELLQKFYKCEIKRQLCAEKPSVPKISYILSYCCPFQHAVFEFAKILSAKTNLNFVDLVPAESQFNDKTPFNMILWGTSRLMKDAARKLAVECSKEFLKFVQNDKRTLDYMVERSTSKYSHDEATFPEVRHIGLRISFWDENIDRQPEPYIAEIRLYDGKFKYFTADDGQRLVLAYEETFDDAQAFLKSLSDTPS